MRKASDNPEEAVGGVINLYKPVGRSSAHFVYRLRPILGIRKIGHAGTLDPFAEGVLLACVGRATKLVERLMELPKQYCTVIRLGVSNETFDTERPMEPVPGAAEAPRAAIEELIGSWVGDVQQVPPVFSAMRIGGTLSYRLAKQGRPAVLAARTVRIDRIDLIAYEWPRLELRVCCGRGTYIRALARDIGTHLKCGAVCESLMREAVGPFRAEDALHLEGMSPARVAERLIPVEEVIRRI